VPWNSFEIIGGGRHWTLDDRSGNLGKIHAAAQADRRVIESWLRPLFLFKPKRKLASSRLSGMTGKNRSKIMKKPKEEINQGSSIPGKLRIQKKLNGQTSMIKAGISYFG